MEQLRTKLNEAYQFAKKWFWALPVWKRAILSSFIGAFGGSSIVGFFNRYALYWHALQKGFRVPVEGVEYLDLAVSLLSFAFIFTSVVGSVLIYYFMDQVGDVVSKILVGTEDSKKRSMAKRITILIQALTPILIFLGEMISDLPKIMEELKFDGDEFGLIKTIAAAVVTPIALLLIGYILQNKESRKKAFTLVLVIVALTGITFSLFNQSVYGYFLYKIGYGGERNVVVEYRTADNTQAVQDGSLMIKTSSSVTIRSTLGLHEIPNERISKLTYLE